MSFEVCALTNCADDHFFLAKWLEHYGRILGGRHHLFVILDGPDPIAREIAQGASVIEMPRRPGDHKFERNRWLVLQSMVETLRHKFDCVICGDVDELVALSPRFAAESGHTLVTYLAERAAEEKTPRISPLAFDIIENTSTEVPLDPLVPVLHQRRFGRLSSKYSKPCIIFNATEIKLRMGGHVGPKEIWNVDKNLFLFHLKAVDTAISDAVSAARQMRVVDLESAGADADAHGIRGWRDGSKYIDESRVWLVDQLGELRNLDDVNLDALVKQYQRRRKRIGRCPSIIVGPLALGPEWADVF